MTLEDPESQLVGAQHGLSLEKKNSGVSYSSDTDEEEKGRISYNNCSWEKTAALLFSEYICLAIMSFPWSYSVLGLIPGLIITVFVAFTTWYTGLIIGDYCAEFPGFLNVCDIGQHLFWGWRWVYWATAACFVANNTLIQALHVIVGTKYFDTITDNVEGGSLNVCSIVFGIVTAVACLLVSLPRNFSQMSIIGIFSAATMFVAVILSISFAATQSHPNGYVETDPVVWNLWPVKGTSYVSGMGAFLNITYTFVGQITYPSFISQMKNPKDFRKALTAVTMSEVILFSLAGAVIYIYVGNDYMTAPAFGSLIGNGKKIAYSFALPTILFLGSLYSNVSAQFMFVKIFGQDSHHHTEHTFTGWAVWIGLNTILWVIAFVLGEAIPFFSDLLSLMSSLFDCWFGFVFWGMAYFKLRKHWNSNFTILSGLKSDGLKGKVEIIINIFLILTGIYMLGPGTYASVESIILSYQSHSYGSAFSCARVGI